MMAEVRSRPDVQSDALYLGGLSRGGALSVAYAAGRSGAGNIRGVINFVGGWMGDQCGDAVEINRTLMARPDGAPSTVPAASSQSK